MKKHVYNFLFNSVYNYTKQWTKNSKIFFSFFSILLLDSSIPLFFNTFKNISNKIY